MLSEEKIQSNWDKFLGAIKDQEGDLKKGDSNRWTLLHDFYTTYEQRFAFMPASGKLHFHSAYPGGHIDHTLRVYETASRLTKLWEKMGAPIDFTTEELAFAALNHDIGKFGTYDAETFIDQDSDWHRNRGEVYKHNHEVPFMKDYDRSLYLLQDLGIKMTETEYLAIKLQSGLYEDSNKSYFIAFAPEFKLHSNLPYIIHQADAMSARIESQLAPKPEPAPAKTFYKKKSSTAPRPKLNKFLID